MFPCDIMRFVNNHLVVACYSQQLSSLVQTVAGDAMRISRVNGSIKSIVVLVGATHAVVGGVFISCLP